MVKYIRASVEAWVVFQLPVVLCAHNHDIADFMAVLQCSTKEKHSIFDVDIISTGFLIVKPTINP